MKEELIDIHDPLLDICKRLGLEYNFVSEITWRPREASAIVFLKGDEGQKYVIDETGEPATETIHFRVMT